MKRKKKVKKITPQELKAMRTKEIMKDFIRLTSKPFYKDAEYVVNEVLMPKYFIMPSTIWLIIRGTGYYKK